MVKSSEPSKISWEEDFSSEDEKRISSRILATITSGLVIPIEGQHRLYFFIPTPAPYQEAESNFAFALEAAGVKSFERRVLMLPRGGRCFAVLGDDSFLALLPLAFHLGPPELTFIAANCRFSLQTQEEEILNFILAILENGAPDPKNVSGMHFDSGDLVEVF